MASTVGVAPALQTLSLESSRRMSKPVAGNAGSTFSSSSFLGEKCQLLICSSNVSQGPVSRSFHALCARMESSGAHSSSRRSSPDGDVIPSWNGDKSTVFQSSSQRAAVATSGFVVAEDSVDVLGFRRDRNVVMEDRSGGGLSGRTDGRAGNVEEGIGAEVDVSDISLLGLKEELVGVLASRGITQLFPIQKAVLKPALKGIDVIGRARTGTGKTLAFGIPIIQRLLEQNDHSQSARRFGRPPRALVLAPTRELAVQVEKEFMESAPNLSTICVYGGVSITAQQRKLQKGVDVAVGTPGRVIDLIERGFLMLNEVTYMVLDEADQMLAVGFEEDVEKILDELPSDRQSMLFSATMPSWVLKLARKYLRSPLNIDLVGDSDEKLAEGIKIYSVATPVTAKRSILNDLITVYGKRGKTIIFTQTKKDADEVALSMTRMLGAEALHGDISQIQREKTLTAFRNGKFSVLVATDVAARGLDIPNVDLVIHYEIPNDPETFVHRSGRTGRAGKEGVTILMHSDSQFRTVRTIERDIGCKFETIGPPHVNDVLRSSSEHAEEALSKVHPELTTVFLPTAEKLLKEKGVEAFAAAIAHLSGFTQPPASRSLITHGEGWTTLQITRSAMWGGGLSSVRNVMGALSSIYPRAADEVGKIRILDEQEGNGAVFDLPEDIAKELLTKERPAEDFIAVVSKLPRLRYDDEAPRDRYGRFSQRGGSSRTGGSVGRSDLSTWRRQDQRAFGTIQDSGFGRRQEEHSKAWSDDWSVSRKQEWQPNFSRRQEERPKAWSDDWSMNRKQEGQPIFGRKQEEGPKTWSANSSNSRKQEGPLDDNFLRVFNQVCENCGQQGHRAAICPKRR